MPESRSRLIDDPGTVADEPTHDVKQYAFDGNSDIVTCKNVAIAFNIALHTDLIGSNDQIVNHVFLAGLAGDCFQHPLHKTRISLFNPGQSLLADDALGHPQRDRRMVRSAILPPVQEVSIDVVADGP